MRAVQLLVSLSSVFAADELFFCSPVEGTMPATNDAIVRERCLTQGLDHCPLGTSDEGGICLAGHGIRYQAWLKGMMGGNTHPWPAEVGGAFPKLAVKMTVPEGSCATVREGLQRTVSSPFSYYVRTSWT